MATNPAEILRRIQVDAHAEWETPDFPRIEKVVRYIQRRYPKPGRVLDIGYSPRGFADSLQKLGWNCIGLDLCMRRTPPVPFLVADAGAVFPLQPNRFDVVAAGEIIEHVPDERSFLAECYRILVPGGLLVITTPNLCFSLNRLLVLFGRLPLFVTAPFHVRFYNRSSLLQTLSSAGFQTLHLSASHLLYSRRRHPTGWIFEKLADWFPSYGAHLIAYVLKPS